MTTAIHELPERKPGRPKMVPPGLPLRLRQLRNKAGLSQTALAEQLGVGWRSISFLENGQRGPALQTLVRYAAFFDLSLDELVWGK